MNTTQLYLESWKEARTWFTNLLKDCNDEDLEKKLINTKNSAGFLIRHVADVELLFAKNVFGASDIKVQAKTLIDQHDTGEWTNLEELLQYQQNAYNHLNAIIEKQTDDDWQHVITTKEFGNKTKSRSY